MMSVNYYRTILLGFVASLLLLAGCAKDNVEDIDSPLKFSTCVPEIVVSKASAVTAVTDFFTMGYSDAEQWFPSEGTTPVNVVLSSGSKSYPDYFWKKGATKTFYAYSNNLPSGSASASIDKDGVKLNYTAIPNDASNQKDILLGRYDGDGDNAGTAALKFYHPLAQVAFKVGTVSGISAISSIKMEGVYRSGSTTLSKSTTASGTPEVADFVWTGTSGYETVSQTVSGSLPSKDSPVGVPFMLIPQDMSSQNVKVTLEATINGKSTLLSYKITGDKFITGKTTTYAINYDAGNGLNFTANAVAWVAGNTLTPALEEVPPQPDDEIWYTSTDGKIIAAYRDAPTSTIFFGAKLLTNTYSDGKGIMKFDGPVTKLYSAIDDSNVDEIWLPNSVEELDHESFSVSGAQIIKIHLPDGLKTINGSAIYNVDNHSNQVYAFVTSTDEYTLYAHKDGTSITSYKLHLGSTSGPTSFTIMPQNITFTCGTVYCFAKGTLLTLADGTQKKVEELTYSDKLKVWNFDEGKNDTAGILWMNPAGQECPYFFRCVLSDGTVLDLVGEETEGTHRLFDKTAGKFLYPDQMAPGSKVYTEHGLAEVVSFERIDEEVEFYNLITDRHINCYINNVLSSCRYNNIYPIDENMKFVKDNRKIRPYSEFKAAGISREWYVGMRLGEQTFDVEDVASYIAKCEAHMAEKPAPTFWQKFRTWWKSIFG